MYGWIIAVCVALFTPEQRFNDWLSAETHRLGIQSMTTLWLDASVTGGEGSQTDPYGSFAEMFAGEGSLSGSVTIYAKGTFFEQVEFSTPMTELSILRWPGEAQPKLRPVEHVTNWEVHSTAGTSDVYRQPSAEPLSFSTPHVVVDWETTNADGLYGHSPNTGFMKEQAGIGDLQTVDFGWFQNFADRLYISIPKGASPDDYTIYACEKTDVIADGHAFEISTSIGEITIDLDIALATKDDGNQQGNLLDINGASFTKLTMIDTNLQGAYYHNFVTRGESHGTIEFVGSRHIMATSWGDNDGILTVYGNSSWTGMAVIDGVDIYGYNYTDVDGNAVNYGTIGGFGHHAGASADIPESGVIFRNCRFFQDPLANDREHVAMRLIANNTQHAVPSDRFNSREYSVRIEDCDFEGKVKLGGGNNAVYSCAIERSRIGGDISDISSFSAEAGYVNIATGTGSSTYVLIDGCVFNPALADLTNSSVFSISGSGTEELQVRHSSVRPVGSGFTAGVGLINFSSSAGSSGNKDGITFQGCVFDSEDSTIFLYRNSGDYNAQSTLKQNLYSTRLNRTANAAYGSDILNDAGSRDIEDETELPGEGIFDVAPAYDDIATLKPDRDTARNKVSGTRGPQYGYNWALFDRTVGAHQGGFKLIGRTGVR